MIATFETTTVWKLGNQVVKGKTTIIARNVTYIEKVPEETPSYLDGQITRINLVASDMFSGEAYETVVEKWQAALKETD